ncbi:MAG: hypothetical protein LBH96_06355, partial [Candidatus Peribacteria bacterium]|nr:hypothetical protein [Candidatus Peribacteria bacterium]
MALKSLDNFATSGKELATTLQDQGLVTENITWAVLAAEAMDLMIEAVEKVGNNAEAIKDYIT